MSSRRKTTVTLRYDVLTIWKSFLHLFKRRNCPTCAEKLKFIARVFLRLSVGVTPQNWIFCFSFRVKREVSRENITNKSLNFPVFSWFIHSLHSFIRYPEKNPFSSAVHDDFLAAPINSCCRILHPSAGPPFPSIRLVQWMRFFSCWKITHRTKSTTNYFQKMAPIFRRVSRYTNSIHPKSEEKSLCWSGQPWL